MSTRFQPSRATLRQKKLQWMNLLCHGHDIFCDCASPLEHTTILIFQQEPELHFNPIEKDIIKKCLSGEEDATAHTGEIKEEDIIQPGDLEELFKEELGEENDTG